MQFVMRSPLSRHLLHPTDHVYHHIRYFSTEGVAKFNSEAHQTTCIPSQLPLSTYNSILHYVTHILNLYLSTGIFPSPIKHALVTLIFKKVHTGPHHCEQHETHHHAPVCPKPLHLVYYCLMYHLTNDNNLIEPFKFGFCPQNSTETALLNSINDLITAKTKGHYSVLILLKYFEAVDHVVLHKLGLRDAAFSCFSFYLSQCTFNVT